MFHLLNDLSKRGPPGTGCGRGQTRESLNEVRSHVNHLSALSDQFLVHVIPKDGLSLNVLGDLSGRSFWLLMICLSSFDQMKVDRCEVHEIPKGDLSLILPDGPMDAPNGHSFLLRGQMSFALRKVCQKMVDLFLEHEIPKDGQSAMLAYARSLNQNRVSRYKKVCLTSSFFPGGRRLVLRCVAYQSTRALERGHLILEHRRSFWCRAQRGHQLCDEACDLLQF
jgi:hypothetical protein